MPNCLRSALADGRSFCRRLVGGPRPCQQLNLESRTAARTVFGPQPRRPQRVPSIQ